MKTIILSVLAALVCQASARIGETPDECRARYGEPISQDKDKQSMAFKMAGMTILVTFLKGTAHHIIIAKTEKDVLDQPLEMSKTERETIVAANARDKKLKAGTEGGIMDQSWETEDGTLIAVYFASDKILVISTREHAELEQKKKLQAEKDNLKGF